MGYILYLKIKAAVGRKRRELSPDIWEVIQSLDLLVINGNDQVIHRL
jgi:hypothetical protein